MKLLLDDRSFNFSSRLTGWERYSRELLPRLANQLPMAEMLNLNPTSHFELIRSDWWDLPRSVRGDTVFMPSYPPTPALRLRNVIWVVHDLTWLRYPQYSSLMGRHYYRRWLDVALKEARLLITPSFAVRDEILGLGVPAERVVAIHPGVAPLFRLGGGHNGDESRKGKTRPYFLTVGSVEPRKNLGLLARCWEDRKLSSEVDLVIAGRLAWGELPNGVRWVNSPSDSELADLYRNAAGFILPSFYEGFGLPLVEAALFGIPIACSDIPVFREVTGGAARFFNPSSVEEARQAVFDTLEATRSFADPVDFSWDKTAQLTASVLSERGVLS